MKIKQGFSLIEVLLVLGIIAVVTAMGFSISKKGMENAYNLYWYTGYVALWDSIVDCNDKSDNPENLTAVDYARHLHMLIRSESDLPENSGDTFIAPNGISYTLTDVSNSGDTFIRIDMRIPVHKLRTGAAPNRTVFVYFPSGTVSMVYPANTSSLTGDDLVNLHNRADLLPFVRRDSDPNADDRTRLYDFHDGYCTMRGMTDGTLSGQPDPANIDCSGFPAQGCEGRLVPINPRKAY